MSRQGLDEIAALQKDVRWLQDALNAQAIERDRRVKEIERLHHDIERHVEITAGLATEVERLKELADHYETEWVKCSQYLNKIAGQRDALKAERDSIIERLTKERDRYRAALTDIAWGDFGGPEGMSECATHALKGTKE